MDPLVHTRDQGTVETVSFARRTCSEEGKHCLTRCDLYRLPGKGQTGHRALLCRTIRPIRRRIAEKLPDLAKKTCSSTMTTHRLTPLPSSRPNWLNCTTNCCPIYRILQIWPRVTFFFSKLEIVTRWAEIWIEWGGHRRHRGLLCRSQENIFFRWVQEVRASLDQVYQAKRRLCWEINRHFSKIFVFYFVG